MPSDKSVEDLVDKLINRSERFEVVEDKSKKTQEKPFRYITDENEIKSILMPQGIKHATIINLPEAAKKVDGVDVLAGLGDTDTIENVIQKHITSRKFK